MRSRAARYTWPVREPENCPTKLGPWRQLDPSIRRAAAQQLIARAEELFGARVAERAWFTELRAFVEQNP